MSFAELLIIAVGLSMDAFAVSICKGLSVPKMQLKHALICGVYFGGFQALMPAIGYLLGVQFEDIISKVDFWVAFVLLSLIGINMIRESLSKDEDENPCDCCESEPSFSFGTMLPLALATSIDALAVGVSFAALSIGARIIAAVLFIGVITFVLSGVGVKIGNLFGAKFKSKAEFFGGAVLVGMGMKILLEGLGVIG